MNEKLKEKMIELGLCEVLEKRVVDDDNLEQHYSEVLDTIGKILLEQEKIIGKLVNNVKLRIAKICMQKIMDSCKYYFDVYKYRISKRKLKQFSHNYKELKNIISKLFLELEKRMEMLDELSLVKSTFFKQVKHVNSLEQSYNEGKLKTRKEFIFNS